MSSFTANPSLAAILSQIRGVTAIQDCDGHLLGYFAPAPPADEALYAQTSSRIDLAEIERRANSTGRGLTTREVFEHMKTLTNDKQLLSDLQTHIDALSEEERCGSP